jgi:hypothetical protein
VKRPAAPAMLVATAAYVPMGCSRPASEDGASRSSPSITAGTGPAIEPSGAALDAMDPCEGLDGIVPDTILQGRMRVGGHDAVQHHDGNLVCMGSLAVSMSTSVDVGTATAKQVKDAIPGDLARSCQVSERTARLAEARRP